MRVRRVVIAPFSAADMFALADDIESYPRFLPWCASASVSRRPADSPGDELVEASLEVNYHGLHRRFATHNVHRRPHSIEMHLAEGPLSHLDGFWKFEELRDGRCRAEFFLEYGFSGRFLNGLVGGVFRRIFENFADAFIVRAREIYPPPPPSLNESK